jgi:hypothetical protein
MSKEWFVEYSFACNYLSADFKTVILYVLINGYAIVLVCLSKVKTYSFSGIV